MAMVQQKDGYTPVTTVVLQQSQTDQRRCLRPSAWHSGRLASRSLARLRPIEVVIQIGIFLFLAKRQHQYEKKHRFENRYHYMQFLLLDTFSLWVLHNQMRPRTNNPSISRPFDWGKTLCPGLCLLTPAQTTLCRRAANTQQVWTQYGGWVDVGTAQIAMRQVPMMRWQHDNYFEDSPEASSRCVRCLVSAPVDVEWYWDSSPVTPN